MKGAILLFNLCLCNLFLYGQVPESDSLALVALYNSTKGDSWTDHTNWLQPGKQVSDWFGITVTENRVTKIELFSNNLEGIIPAEIGNLLNLSFLHLSDNQLSGAVPPEIGYLENLTDLYLQSNMLTDSIPAEIGQLINLKHINLSRNDFRGSIPDGICNLSSLIFLFLSQNQLTGTIPEEIGNLGNLERLVISNNQLTGSLPPGIGNLTGLIYLEVQNNELKGEIPPEIGSLTNLVYMHLSSNNFCGDIPVELFGLSKLEILSLYGNQLSGAIPPEIGNLTNLRQLTIYDNQFEDSIPDEIGMLDKLTSIFIYNNQFTGPIPSAIKSLPELGNLRLKNNYFTFFDLEVLKGMAIAYFSYSPQLPVKINVGLITGSTGDDIGLDLTTLAVPKVEAENNRYQWWRGSDSLSSYSPSPYLSLSDVDDSDQGYYKCRMKNTNFPELTLITDSVYLEIDGPVDITLTPDSVNENVTSGTMVGLLSAEDPDQSEGHSFAFIEGNGINDADNGLFSIGDDTLFIHTSPDFETRQEYFINIRTTDKDSKTFDKALVVKVNDIQESEPTGMTFQSIPEDKLKVYPNPSSDHIILEYNSEVGETLSAELYDLRGLFISSLFSQKALQPGIIKVYLYFSKRIPSGNYILVISNNVCKQNIMINKMK